MGELILDVVGRLLPLRLRLLLLHRVLHGVVSLRSLVLSGVAVQHLLILLEPLLLRRALSICRDKLSARNRLSAFISDLSDMLRDQEEVEPVPLGDSVVQHCPRGRVVGVLASQGEDPRVDPLLHHDEAKAGRVVC